MNIKTCLLILFIVLTSVNTSLAGDLYVIDNDQTHVRFASKMCEADLLLGEFSKIDGEIFFDEDNPEQSYVTVNIDGSGAHFNKEYHGEDHIDTIVKGEKFLNISLFPTITFKSTKIIKTSDFTADIIGDMTLVGNTRPFTLAVTFHEETGKSDGNRQIVAFSAEGKFKRSDYGILYALDRIGIRRIGDEVTVLISTTANKKN